MALTKVTSGGLTDDSIVNADINSSAAIAFSKLATDPSNASLLASGTVPTARLGSGTASSSTVLYGDQTYKTEPTGGKILQVVSATDDTQVDTTSTSFVTASNVLTVDITPSATSSKIYVVYNTVCYYTTQSNSLYTTLYRDSTNLGQTDYGLTRQFNVVETNIAETHAANYLDSPSSTSALTYQVYFRVLAGTGWMNAQSKAVITAMEIGA